MLVRIYSLGAATRQLQHLRFSVLKAPSEIYLLGHVADEENDKSTRENSFNSEGTRSWQHNGALKG